MEACYLLKPEEWISLPSKKWCNSTISLLKGKTYALQGHMRFPGTVKSEQIQFYADVGSRASMWKVAFYQCNFLCFTWSLTKDTKAEKPSWASQSTFSEKATVQSILLVTQNSVKRVKNYSYFPSYHKSLKTY